jgi:hypothetical protein
MLQLEGCYYDVLDAKGEPRRRRFRRIVKGVGTGHGDVHAN